MDAPNGFQGAAATAAHNILRHAALSTLVKNTPDRRLCDSAIMTNTTTTTTTTTTAPAVPATPRLMVY